MAIKLPLPVRVAAGLLATGIQLVRSLPEEIPAIPVALVGNAMRLSMKVQQEITTLATRGDELLGGVVGGRPQERPSWATFDEDTAPPAPRAPGRPAKPRPAPAKPPAGPATSPDDTKQADGLPDREPAAPSAPDSPPAADPAPPVAAEFDGQARRTPEATALSDTDTTAVQAAAGMPDAVLEAALHAGPDPVPAEPTPDGVDVESATDGPAEPATPVDDSTGESSGASPRADEAAVDEAAVDEAAVDEAAVDGNDEAAGPAALPGYDRMTLAQVRGHLRELTVADVSDLLAYEQTGENRAPFLTLLGNRLVTLGAQES